MKRDTLIENVKALGFIVYINADETALNTNKSINPTITIYLNENKHLILTTIDDTKPFTFKNHELFDILSLERKLKLYNLVSQYAGTLINYRN